jgi:Host cell surface-exposed lipoprotein
MSKGKIALIAGAGILLLGIGGAIGSSGSSDKKDTPSPPPTTQAPYVTLPPQTLAPTAPAFTVSQQNAIESAKSYLESSGFSRLGLIEQLEFEKFSKADALFAVNHVTVNWNQEAVQSANEYLDSSSFSCRSLIEQLEFDQFTHSQAVYGAKQTGLC